MSCDNTDLNYYLKHGVIAEADHDFLGGYNKHMISGTDLNICPKIPIINKRTKRATTFSEDSMLYELFETSRILGLAEKMKDKEKNTDPGTFTSDLVNRLTIAGGKLVFESLLNNQYEASILQKDNEPFDISKPGITEENIKDFFGNSKIYLLIDTNTINVLEFLSKITKRNLIIYQIINREELNDSAPKSHANLESIHQYTDTTNTTILYDKDKFYSKYDLTLGKPYKDTPDGILKTEFKISYKGTELYTTTDSNDNSIAKCEDAFTESKKNFTQETEWPVIYQRKRSGDWLQVLSCLYKDREYNDTKRIPHSNNIILVTGDRLCLYYAILMGVNVLYTTHDKKLIYFKNLSAVPAAAEKAAAEKAALALKIAERTVPVISNAERRLGEMILRKNQTRRYISYPQTGGTLSQELCKKYLIELINDLDGFDSDEDSDYLYYEHVACVVSACIKEFYKSDNAYDKIQAILFDIFPSIEGHIKTKEPEIIQFFKDQNTADCVSFAARNVALHAINLRTGQIDSLGNREKYNVHIPRSTVETYRSMQSYLPTDFLERRTILINTLKKYIETPLTLRMSKKLGSMDTSRSLIFNRTISNPSIMAPAAGGRYNKTRKLKRFKKVRRTRKI
jgi:hypothetical protein